MSIHATVASAEDHAEQHLSQHARPQANLHTQETALAAVNGQPVPRRRQHQHEPASASEPARILPLSPQAIAQIHSSKHITTLHGVVASLLENSLDAGATKIDVSVDWRRGDCSIDDNGIGIQAAEFAEDGGLGKMYCTSKRYAWGFKNGPNHGSTGTFLAELAAMSLLRITSMHRQSTTPCVLAMHHGKVMSRQTIDAQTMSCADMHHKHGTSVTVRDLFGSMPVRVKQRALATENGNGVDKAWSELKYSAVALVLTWPRPCTIKLRDVHNDFRKLNLTSGSSGALTKRRLGQLTGRSASHDLRDALPVIFQASLAAADSRSQWIPLSASTTSITLKGMICLEPAPTKQCQFIAIGITPCIQGDNNHELYRAINKLFANSSFGVLEDGPPRTAGDYSSKQVKAQKGPDRHAMYFLQLSFCDLTQGCDPNDGSMKETTLKSLVEVLEAATHAWLESNHFRPRTRRRRRNNDQDRPATSRLSSPPLQSASQSIKTSRSRNGNVATGHCEMDRREQTSKRRRVVDLSTETLAERPATADPLLVDGQWHIDSRARSGLLRALPKRSASPRPGHPAVSDQSADLHQLRTNLHSAHGTVNPVRVAPLSVGQLNDSRSSPRHEVPAKLASSDDFGFIDDADLLLAETPHEENTISWTDPVSKNIFRIDSRTGVVLPVAEYAVQASATGRRPRAAIETTVSSTGMPVSLARRSALAKSGPTTSEPEKEKWLPGFLKEWKNPVFAQRNEEAIPTASLSGSGLIEQLEEERRCCADNKYHRAFARRGEQASGGTSLSRAALQHAEVIGQVDQKFILVRMPSSREDTPGGTTLVLIDQHAASERIVLEDLLTDMISTSTDRPNNSIIKSTSLLHGTTRAKNLTFDISAREHDLFTHHQPHFHHWGITYALPPPASASTLSSHSRTSTQSYRLILTHLPTAISERCSSFPALAIELLREEIWTLVDGARKPTTTLPLPQSDSSSPQWLSHLPHMPAKMLSMLHSRACRSAVMFNDVLSLQECADLVRQLSDCTFPFVCAHGRVGMVPIMDMGVTSGTGDLDEGLGRMAGFRAEDAQDREWDGREEVVDVHKLERFMMSCKRDKDEHENGHESEDEDEEMSEASPHKFARKETSGVE